MKATSDGPRVYLLYHPNDLEIAKRLGTMLRAEHAIDVWLDVWEIGVGDSEIGKIEEAIEKSHGGLVLLSDHGLGDELERATYTALLRRALKDGKYVIPVRHGLMPTIPVLLEDRRSVDSADEKAILRAILRNHARIESSKPPLELNPAKARPTSPPWHPAAYVARDWIPKLIDRLGEISDARTAKLDELAHDFRNPQELARYYVEPDCQPENPANQPDGERHEHRKPAFETIDHFLQRPSLDDDGTNHLIVLGDTGMGKSWLLVMLWKLHLFDFWPRDTECTLLKLGPTTLAKIKELPAPARHILLLDSLDEDSSVSAESGGVKARLVELIHASKGFRKVIISCRTQFFVDEDDDPEFAKLGNVRLDGFMSQITYLSPFDDRQAKKLLKKRFPDNWRNYLFFRRNEAQEKALGIAEAMGSLNMRPLLLSYIPWLLGNNSNHLDPLDIHGEDRDYEIYRLIVTRWLDREVTKIRDREASRIRDAARVPSESELREVCWQVATNMKLDGRPRVSREEFETLKAQVGAQAFLADNALEARALLNRDSSCNFLFAHYSIQEFLVAEYCLARGVFIRGDSKFDLDASTLMWQFFEQRLRKNVRSLAPSVAFGQTRLRGVSKVTYAFAIDRLVTLSRTLIEFCRESAAHRNGMTFALASGDWSEISRKIDPVALPHEVDSVDNADDIKMQILNKEINLFKWRSKREYTWYNGMEELGRGSVEDLVNFVHKTYVHHMAPLAAQFAAGVFNLGIPEDRLAMICREEVEKTGALG